MIDALVILTIVISLLALSGVVMSNHRTNKTIMQTQAERAASLNKLNQQKLKIAKEQSDRFDAVTARIKELEDAIANATVTDEVKTAFAGLQEAADALDATIPDAPAPAE